MLYKIIIIISGKYKNKLGKIVKKKNYNYYIENINTLNKFFKIKFNNKYRYIFKSKIFFTSNSNLKLFDFKKI